MNSSSIAIAETIQLQPPMDQKIRRKIKVKEYTRKELAKEYGVSLYIFNKRVDAMLEKQEIKEKFGKIVGHSFQIFQVKIIFKHMELPYEYEVDMD